MSTVLGGSAQSGEPRSGLSLMELAVLEFSSNAIVSRWPEPSIISELRSYFFEKKNAPVLVPAKGSYIWGVTIAIILNTNPDADEEAIFNAFRTAWREANSELKRHFLEPSLSIEREFEWQSRYFRLLYGGFVSQFGLDIDETYQYAMDAGREAYTSLMNRGLLLDPIVAPVLGVPVAVFGFIPYCFDRRTEDGNVTYTRIKAAFWNYERKSQEGVVETKVEFKLLRYIKAFKRGFQTALSEMSNDEGGRR